MEAVRSLQDRLQGGLLPDPAEAFFPGDLDAAVARRLGERLDVLRRGIAARALDG